MNKKRVLFVDGDANVIAGLRRLLRKQRDAWDTTFATSGPEALAKLAATPHDVIITCLHMTGMDGADLLERVIGAYPRMARIILSGHPSEEGTKKAVNLAHQFLSKPIEADALIEAVARACAAQRIVGDDRLRDIVGGCQTLPSLPTLYVEITQAANSDHSDAQAVGRIVGKDMAMSAKLLKLVNSSFFGIGRRVSSTTEAVALLGVTRIKALVLSEHVFGQFAPKQSLTRFSIENLWQHSCEVAEVARLISRAEQQTGDRPDQAFTGGVLHDVGILLLASHYTQLFDTMMTVVERDGRPQSEVEKETFGVTHEEVGEFLLTLWGLPPRIVEAVAFHHRPSQIAYDGLCGASCVHTADALLTAMGHSHAGPGGEPGVPLLDLAYLRRIGCDHRVEAWTELAASVVDRVMAASA
jgi:HD-like signal output (HDOD) protein/CheY-like chemotaxis protein